MSNEQQAQTQRRWTDEDADGVARLRAKGKGCQAIADAYGVSRSSIYALAERRWMPKLPRGGIR